MSTDVYDYLRTPASEAVVAQLRVAVAAAAAKAPVAVCTFPQHGSIGLCECGEHEAVAFITWTVWHNAAESETKDRYACPDHLASTVATADREVNGILWNYDDEITVEGAVSTIIAISSPVAA